MKLKIKNVIFLLRHFNMTCGNPLTNSKFDESLKKHCNIYGRLRLELIGLNTKSYHTRLLYLFKFVGIGLNSDHSSSRVSFCQFHNLFAFKAGYSPISE